MKVVTELAHVDGRGKMTVVLDKIELHLAGEDAELLGILVELANFF